MSVGKIALYAQLLVLYREYKTNIFGHLWIGSQSDLRKANLGRFIRSAKKHALLSDLEPHLKELNGQRNYLAHNIHALFHGFIEETVLERTGLLDSDTHTFMERAWQLAENLNGLADIVAKYDENT